MSTTIWHSDENVAAHNAQHIKVFNADYSRTFNSTAINELRAGYFRFKKTRGPRGSSNGGGLVGRDYFRCGEIRKEGVAEGGDLLPSAGRPTS
jgi:hypothetical protein